MKTHKPNSHNPIFSRILVVISCLGLAASWLHQPSPAVAKANHGRDPLYLFAALQRQLNYPEVPRIKAKDDPAVKFLEMRAKIRELETRLKLVEGELRGNVDLSEFMAKPDLIKPVDDLD